MGKPEVILLIAISVALAAWAVTQIFLSYFSTDKNRIQQRLSNNWRPDISSALNKPVTISLEMKEIPAFLARSAYMQRLYRKLVQAYPEAKLTAFLSICLGSGLAAAVLVILIVDSFTGGLFAFFVTAVLIQRQTGGDLTEVLDRISAMVRGRIRLQNHVKAITAEGRLTGHILVAFPAILFVISYILNPGYAGILIREELGKMLLGASVLFQIFGLFVIRKIVSVRI